MRWPGDDGPVLPAAGASRDLPTARRCAVADGRRLPESSRPVSAIPASRSRRSEYPGAPAVCRRSSSAALLPPGAGRSPASRIRDWRAAVWTGEGAARTRRRRHLGAYYFVPPRRRVATGHGARRRWPAPAFDVDAIRRDFPILQERVHGKQLVWLDNAATTQKPQRRDRSAARTSTRTRTRTSIARAHTLAARSTDAYEAAREKVRALPRRRLGRERSSSCAARPRRSTSSPTAGAANPAARRRDHPRRRSSTTPTSCPGRCSPRRGAKLRVIPVDDRGEVLLERVRASCSARAPAGRGDARLERARHDPAGRAR